MATVIWMGLGALGALLCIFVYALCVAASRGDDMQSGTDDRW